MNVVMCHKNIATLQNEANWKSSPQFSSASKAWFKSVFKLSISESLPCGKLFRQFKITKCYCHDFP